MDQSGRVVQHGVQVQHFGEVLLPLVSEPSQTLSGVRLPILARPGTGLRIEVPHRPLIGRPEILSRTRNLDLEPELVRRLSEDFQRAAHFLRRQLEPANPVIRLVFQKCRAPANRLDMPRHNCLRRGQKRGSVRGVSGTGSHAEHKHSHGRAAGVLQQLAEGEFQIIHGIFLIVTCSALHSALRIRKSAIGSFVSQRLRRINPGRPPGREPAGEQGYGRKQHRNRDEGQRIAAADAE